MRILIFILLKLIEISAIVFVPYWIGVLVWKISGFRKDDNFLKNWLFGFAHLILIVLVIFAIFALYYFGFFKLLIDTNWHLAGRILGN
jgi:hypothetical protein